MDTQGADAGARVELLPPAAGGPAAPGAIPGASTDPQLETGNGAGEDGMEVDDPVVVNQMRQLNLDQAKAAYSFQDHTGAIYTFPTYEDMRRHVDTLPRNPLAQPKKPVYFGKPPPHFTGQDLEKYSFQDFVDAVTTYAPLAHNSEEDVVRIMHSYILNPCKKWVVNKFQLSGSSIEDYSLDGYKQLVSEFSLTLELSPVDYIQKLFALKLGSLQFDAFLTQFNSILTKCPADITGSHLVMIAAMRQALPGQIQEAIRFTVDGKNWPDFNSFCHAAKEAVRRFGDNKSAVKPKSNNNGSQSGQHHHNNNKKKNSVPVRNAGVQKAKARVDPPMNNQVSTQAAAALGTTRPLNLQGELITLAKYIACGNAGICPRCNQPGHKIRECPTKGKISSVFACVPSLPDFSDSCRSEGGTSCPVQAPVWQQGEGQGGEEACSGPGELNTCVNHVHHVTEISPDPTVPLVSASVSTTTSSDLAPIDVEDVGLMPNIFGHLCKILQLAPTVDAFASTSGVNSLCAQFRSQSNSCFHSLYTGDTVYANPAYSVALNFVAHIIACKVLDPTLGLILLLPVTRPAYSARQLAKKYLQLSHTFPAGSAIFHRPMGDGSRLQCHPCPWPIEVYTFKPSKLTSTSLNLRVRRTLKQLKSKTFVSTPHAVLPDFTAPVVEIDPSLPQVAIDTETEPLHTDSTPLFQFPVTVSGLTCTAQTDSDAASNVNSALHSLFLDTGASVEAIVSRHIATSVNAKIHKLTKLNQLNLTMANGTTALATDYCHLRLNVQGMTSRVKAIVLDVPESNQLDMILGTIWLKRHRVVLNCATGKAIAYKGHRKFTLKPPEPERPKVAAVHSTTKLHLCTIKTARQALARGQQIYLCLVKTVDDLPGSDIDPDIQALLKEFAHILPEDLPELPQDRDLPNVITLVPGANPQFRNRGRYSQPEKDEMKKQIEAGIKQGKIKPSHSPWGAPVLFVPKNTGRGLRMCVDYRALNNLTIKNRYTLPRIDDLLDQLNGVKYMSSLDLLHGYHQIRLKPEEMPMTAFITPFGLYEFTVMPFGLTNAPSVFQSMMNKVLSPLLYKGVMVYLDDILIYSHTKEEHLAKLRQVFQLLADNKLYVCLEKCKFLLPELPFLGHVVTPEGLHPDPKKLSALETMLPPRNVKEAQSFVGFINYFRRFVPKCSLLLRPIILEIKSGAAFQQTPALVEAFHAAISALKTAATLKLPDFTKPFELVTDASKHHVGGILVQEGRPVAFESSLLNTTQQNWPTHDRELYALVYCCKKWRPYIDGTVCTAYTDHGPLQFLQTQKELNSKQVRWLEFLQSFRPNIVYRPGLGNPADALTRLYWVHATACASVSHSHKKDNTCGCSPTVAALPPVALVKQRVMSVGVANDSNFMLAPVQTEVFVSAYKAESDGFYNDTTERLAQLEKQNIFKDVHGLFWHKTPKASRLCVPSSLVQQVLHYCHDDPFAGHLGYHKTLHLATSKYWWRSLRKDVADYCRTCSACQQNKVAPFREKTITPLSIPCGPFQSISMDFITHLPVTPSGHDSVLTIVDRFSKFVILIPCTETITGPKVADLLFNRLVPHYGVPLDFVSDRDSKFTSEFFVQWCSLLGIAQRMSSGFHPQTDGQTERTNRTIEQILRFYVLPDQSNWDTALPMVAFAINRAFNQATKATPFEVILGYNPASPFERLLNFQPESREPIAAWKRNQLDMLQRVQHALNVAQSRMVDYATGHRPTVSLQVGDLVWLSTKHLQLKISGSRKLARRFIGPFPVVKVVNPTAYKLQLPEHMKIHPVFHISELRKVPVGTRLPPEPEIVQVEGQDEFFIEAIIQHKVQKLRSGTSQYLFLTTFQNQGPEENRWLSEADFTSDGLYENPILEHYKQLHGLTTPAADGAIDKSTSGSGGKRRKKA